MLNEILGGGDGNLGAYIWNAAASFSLLQYGQGVSSFKQVVAQGKKFWRPRAWSAPRAAARAQAAPEKSAAWEHARRALAGTEAAFALKHLDKAILLEPRCADFYVLRALVRLGQLLPCVFSRFPRFERLSRKPEDDLKRALQLDPDSVWAHLVYGILEYVKRRFDAAAPHFARAAELEPEWCWARVLKADVIYYLRRIDEAVVEFHKAVELDPKNSWAFALLGRAKNLTLDPSMNRDLDRSVALEPGAGWLYAWRGIAKVAIRHDSAAALKDFDRAKKLDQDYDRIFAWRASQLIKMGRPKEAVADLLKALKINPSLDITHYSLGRAYFLLGRYAEGIGEIKNAVKGSYLSIWIYNWGDWNHQNHARRETLEDLNTVVARAPRAAWAWAWRGQTRLSLMDYAGALEDLDKAVALNPRFAYSFAWRGEVLRRLGREDESKRDLDKALRLDGRCVWAYAWRGRLSLDRGALRSSIEDLTRAIGMNRRLGLAYVWRFQARLRLGDTAKALEDIHAILEFYPTWKWLWYWRARLEASLKVKGGALTALDWVVALSPREESYGLRAHRKWKTGDLRGARADAEAAFGQQPSSWLFKELKDLIDGAGPKPGAPKFLEGPIRRCRKSLRGDGVWDLAADFSCLEKNSSNDESFWIRYDEFEARGSARLKRAIRNLRGAKLGDALKDFEAALAADPKDFGALLIKADCLLKLQPARFEEAAALAGRCLELRPGNSQALLVRYQARKRLGDWSGALADLQAARQNQDLRIVLEEARLRWMMGDFEKALLGAERVLELDPFDQAAQRLRAEALISKGELKRAAAGLDALLSSMPGLRWPLVTRSQILFFQGKTREALTELDKALTGSPAFSYASHGWRAVYLGALGRTREMEESRGRALSLNPLSGIK